ncbi:hypothetical protein [Blastococcus sp. CCUG 61487]|uniref:LGFP repeat-containing protein n=1 Tax=Blastococcus sp. CCUG 61487 TaxID=1840703 RepID=UPI0010C0B7FB|nr:hypothetical protein [Blastococcus sp. CCUG 61487]TKJ28116.1 hypothetical protein A6V29_03140 [Blastococcus sp. CCUG 61487]
MSRSTRPPRRAAAALVTAAVAAVVGLGGASAAQADTFRWTSPNYITYTVQGAILDHYRAHGGPNGRLNYPFSDELAMPDRFGRFTVFGGGSIYWTPWTGAHAVWGAILGRWGSLGWEAGQLGYPTTDELVTPDRVGRVQVFQRGLVYWTPWTGAHAVWGAIQQRYAALGWERSAIAYPTTSEFATPDGRGRYNTFSRGGAIYWTTSTGAHAVWGAIWQTYSSNGWEAGPLGYPVTSELPTPDGIGRFNHFEDGSIYFSPATGAYAVTSEFRDVWASMG